MESDSEQIDKILHQNYSADLYMDQKRKISEILHIHDGKQSNHINESTLVINPKSKQKNKSTPSKNQVEHSREQSLDDNYNLKDLTLTLDDQEAWEYCTFDYENVDTEDLPVTTSSVSPFSEFKTESNKSIDIRNTILKSTSLFNLSR